MMKQIKEKLNSRSGYSLIELLACIIVLVLVTAIITLVVNMSVKYYTQSMRQSAADILCASLSTATQEELEYATTIKEAGTATSVTDTNTGLTSQYYSDFTYYSRARRHGPNCTIAEDGTGALSVAKVHTDDSGNKTMVYYPLVNSSSYAHGITSDIQIKYYPDQPPGQTAPYFNVTISIIYDGDELSANTFNVYPINEGN